METFNRAIAAGTLNDPKRRKIRIARIALDRNLPSRSKMDRNPDLLGDLREYGQTKSRWFLKDRNAWAERSVGLGVSPS